MSSVQSILGVIFDMDGVLCDSERFICEAAMKMFEQVHHVRVSPEDFVPFIGAGEDRYLGGPAQKHHVPLVMPRDKLTTYDIYLQIIRGRLHPLPGAVPFIRACRDAGLKLALATSADAIKMRGNLREIGIDESSFAAVVTGNDVERKKPDPQIFQLAAKRLDLDPARCLVVEDATNGVKAGKAAGCRCLGITTSFDDATLRAVGADFTAQDLAHVPAEALR